MYLTKKGAKAPNLHPKPSKQRRQRNWHTRNLTDPHPTTNPNKAQRPKCLIKTRSRTNPSRKHQHAPTTTSRPTERQTKRKRPRRQGTRTTNSQPSTDTNPPDPNTPSQRHRSSHRRRTTKRPSNPSRSDYRAEISNRGQRRPHKRNRCRTQHSKEPTEESEHRRNGFREPPKRASHTQAERLGAGCGLRCAGNVLG